MPSNPFYSFEEYKLLIRLADSKDELKLIGEQLSEDSQNGHFDIIKFVDLKAQIAVRYSDFTIEEMRRKIEEQ